MARKIAPIVIDLLVRGTPRVEHSVRRVRDVVIKAEGETVSGVVRAAAKRTQSAEKEAAARLRIEERAAKAKQRAQEKVDRELKRLQDKAARDTIAAMLKVDREVARIKDHAEKEAERRLERERKAQDRANREQEKDLKRHAREEARIRVQAEKEADRALEQIRKESIRDQKRSDREAAKWLRDGDRELRREQRASARFATSMLGAGAQGVRAGASRVAGITMGVANTVAQLGGGFSIAGALGKTTAVRGHLADIANNAIMPDDPENSKRRSVDELESKVRSVGIEFGIGSEEGANALDKFTSKTGNLARGMELLRGLAEMSRAGAGSLDDLADAAGDIFNNDETQSAKQVLDTLQGIAIQAGKGAVDMKDLATQMAKLQAAAGKFEGDGAKNMLAMGAISQIARREGGATTASQATTATASLTNQLYKNARIAGFKNLGVSLKTKEGFNRDMEDILIETMLGAEKKSRASGRGMQDFDKLFGSAVSDASARRATLGLEKAFKQAGGGQAGVAAVKAKLAEFGAGGRDLRKEYADKAKERMVESDAKLEVMNAKFEQAVSEKLIPKLLELMPAIERLIPVIVDGAAKAAPAFIELITSISKFVNANKGLIEDIAAHPIGTIMAAEVTKSIGSALLGEAVKNAIQSAIVKGSGSLPLPGDGVGGAAAGAGSKGRNWGGGLLAGMVAGALTYAGFQPGVDAVLEGQTQGQRRAGELTAMIRQGGTAREAAMREVDAAKSMRGAGGALVGGAAGVALPISSVYSAITGDTNFSADHIRKRGIAGEIVDSESIKRAIADAVREGAKQGLSGGGGPSKPDARHEAISNR